MFALGDVSSFNPLTIENSTDKNWINTNTITRYSPNGIPVEEKDALNIYSTAKFGYNKTQPILVSNNARYNEVAFYDFELVENSPSDETTITEIPDPHSGKGVFSYSRFSEAFQMAGNGIYLTDNMLDKTGLRVKFWTRHVTEDQTPTGLKVQINNLAPFNPVLNSKVGNWYLYEVSLTSKDLKEANITGVGLPISIKLTADTDLYIDDIRIQPLEATMACYVYDLGTFRPIVQFDDEHFGVYFTYDDEGKLISKIVETERGKKTTQENHFHLPKASRNE